MDDEGAKRKEGQDNVSLVKDKTLMAVRPFNSLGKPFPPDSGLSSDEVV